MRRTILFLCFSLALFASCSSVEIVDKPIDFDDQRTQLTLDYLKTRYNLEQTKPSIEPKMIVVHWTAIPTLEESYEAFKDPLLPNSRSDITTAGALNVSSHFLVDRDGTIYRLMPETIMARHVIGLNHCALGIENVGGTEGTPLTRKQLKANISLVRYLKEKYPHIDFLIGHLEYTRFEGHPLWLEVDDAYRTEKTDPGVDFINKIRSETSDFNWKPVPLKSE
ncbi:MAG: peptidoglycan recognition family protein [Lutimonas sp.]